MLTLVSALIPVVAGLGYFIAKETQAYWILYFIFVSMIAFILAFAIGIRLFAGGSEYLYFDPEVVVTKYKEKSLRFYTNKLASTLCDISNKNADVVNAKLKNINLMNKCMIIGLIIFGLSFLCLAISLTFPTLNF
jgi:hypothetical protein